LAEGTYSGLLQGAFTGIPYKVFAVEAGSTGINPVLFASLTPLARLPRFIVLSVIAWAAARAFGARLYLRQRLIVTLTLWAGFYAFYFSRIGW
jgi:hypothetical protein